MSVQALSAAFEAQAPSPTAKLLMLALANFADADGACWPSQQRLARDTGLGERTVRRVLAQLEHGGHIVREQQRRGDGSRSSDRFRLLFAQAAKMAGSPQNQPAILTGPPGHCGPTPPVTVAGHEPSIRTVIEPKKREGSLSKPSLRSNRKPETAIPVDFPTTELIEAAQATFDEAGVGVDARTDAQRFRAHALANDRRLRDWPQGHRMWTLKAIEFARKPTNYQRKPWSALAQAIEGLEPMQ